MGFPIEFPYRNPIRNPFIPRIIPGIYPFNIPGVEFIPPIFRPNRFSLKFTGSPLGKVAVVPTFQDRIDSATLDFVTDRYVTMAATLLAERTPTYRSV